MKTPVYLCSYALARQINIHSKESFFDHRVNSIDGTTLLWPDTLNDSCISPRPLCAVKERLKTKKLYVIDRALTVRNIIIISNQLGKNETNEMKILSETIAPITVILYYIGTNVDAIGCGSKITSAPQLIKEIEKIN
ncbi:MAG: hypothetical protein U9N31_05300 [Candidatus Marinimicrobia bacterium]|nr:hypothetical protein [Candidatus Neomarinimicrobiota bacterium]